MRLDELLLTQKILICCGCGGVGKTTTSAALGLRAAELGRSTLVLTIDPAKRLADSLGIGVLTNEPRLVPLPPELPGKLWAMMMDVTHTLDSIIRHNAPNPTQAETILNNHIYQQLSQRLGGGQEYGAMERLFQLHSSQHYELIILDTPPSQHALDFVVAPLHLKEFFSQSVLRFFLEGAPSPSQVSLANKSSALVLKLFEKITGSHFLHDLAEFLQNFQGMYEAFATQAAHVSDLLASPETGFLVISSPEPQQLSESRVLYQKLQEFHLPFRGWIINKCTPRFGVRAEAALPRPLREEVKHLCVQNMRQVDYEDQLLQTFLAPSPALLFQKVPIFPKEVYNVETLREFSHQLSKINESVKK